jgi:hypothetical protein
MRRLSTTDLATTASPAATVLITRHPSGWTEGRDPRAVPQANLANAGHLPQPLLKIIHAKCFDCCAGERAEVARCTAVGCPLWPYRTGANPFAKPRGAGKKSSAKLAQFPSANSPLKTEPGEMSALDVGRVGNRP